MAITVPMAVDTNVLPRGRELNHPHHFAANRAIAELVLQGVSLCLFPQNVREFWNVATRPAGNNGLAMTIEQAERAVQNIEATFTLLPDSPTIYQLWRAYIVHYQVSGVQVHDCNIAAAMAAHGLVHLLTFNPSDFIRYGITVVDPAGI